MKIKQYDLIVGDNFLTFEFISQGAKGGISKIVQFAPTGERNVYNLAFGDKDTNSMEFDDFSISNNGDSEQVLATVVATIYRFAENYPDAWVYATGSTKARTRLYRMGISKYFEEAKEDFYIFGRLQDEWKTFEKGLDYDAFIVKRKMHNFEE